MSVNMVNSLTKNAVNPTDLAKDNTQPGTIDAGQTLTTTASGHSDAAIDHNELNQAVQKLNDYAEKHSQQLRFEMDHKAERIVIQVIDTSTNKVVSTVPPKQILSILEEVNQNGILLDKKA